MRFSLILWNTKKRYSASGNFINCHSSTVTTNQVYDTLHEDFRLCCSDLVVGCQSLVHCLINKYCFKCHSGMPLPHRGNHRHMMIEEKRYYFCSHSTQRSDCYSRCSHLVHNPVNGVCVSTIDCQSRNSNVVESSATQSGLLDPIA